MSIEEIPLSADNQIFSISLQGRQLRLRVTYRDEAGWILDILATDDMPIITGIPLVSGVDLLAAYRHLGLTGGLYLVSEEAAQEYPTKTNLGLHSHLYFVTQK